jgi:hypothetical protein
MNGSAHFRSRGKRRLGGVKSWFSPKPPISVRLRCGVIPGTDLLRVVNQSVPLLGPEVSAA